MPISRWQTTFWGIRPLAPRDPGVWLTERVPREPRLVFGEVAELYDRHRPAYPEQLADDLVSLAGLDGRRAVLEVGAGTGKATAMLAARGIPVVAVEPSEEMASVWRRSCAPYPRVELERGDFETWDPGGRSFPLVFSAQAWHWVNPDVGYVKARSALSPGGLLATFWNRPAWERSDLRGALLAAYRESIPEVVPDGPMHPANTLPGADQDWQAQISATDGLAAVGVRNYDWSQSYSAAEYVGLLDTTSEVRLLTDQQNAALLAAVRATIEAHGDVLTLPLATQLCLARRVP